MDDDVIITTTTASMFPNDMIADVVVDNYKSDKSVLIDLILGTAQCLKQEEDLNFINDIKHKVGF